MEIGVLARPSPGPPTDPGRDRDPWGGADEDEVETHPCVGTSGGRRGWLWRRWVGGAAECPWRPRGLGSTWAERGAQSVDSITEARLSRSQRDSVDCAMPSSLESAQPEAPFGPTMRRTAWALKRSEYLTKSVLAHPTLAAGSGPRVTMGGDNFPDTGGTCAPGPAQSGLRAFRIMTCFEFRSTVFPRWLLRFR
jgi:hypothetical protein